jgi:hypothetical protein
LITIRGVFKQVVLALRVGHQQATIASSLEITG